MEPINGDALRGHLELMVLSGLEQGEAHGLELLRRLEQAGCGALRLREGSLYPALYRLERAGLVSSAWHMGIGQGRGARRRLYRLTWRGTRRLAAGRAEWRHFVTVVSGILGAPA